MKPNQQQFKFTNGVIVYPILMVLLLWLVFWFEIRFGVRFNKFGIKPQSIVGLRGVLFSPFIHSGISHLYHNSIPLLILSSALFYFYNKIAWRVIGLGILLSGLLTWIIARPSYHIGASGLIYVLVSFIFFKGIFTKHYRLVALSFLVVFLYGSMIWYVFPIKEGISWEGHLSGLIIGLLFALLFRKEIAKPQKYIWEESNYNEENDEFLKHFDENGNFIEIHEPDLSTTEAIEQELIRINYIFKPKDKSTND